MPSKKKKICIRKVANKKTAKTKLITLEVDKNRVGDTTTSANSHVRKTVSCKKQDTLKPIYPFNKFAITAYRGTNFSAVPKNMPLINTHRTSGLSSKEKNYIICSCQTKSTRYLSLKSLALRAIEEHKVFTIYGRCNAIRQALLERGWVEKLPSYRMNLTKIKNGTLTTAPAINSELERLLLSTLVSKYPPNFIWHSKEEITDNTVDLSKDCTTIENKLMADALWTSKQGLCTSMKRNYWFYIEDVSEVTGPRSYSTNDSGEIDDFIKDYKITACTSLLKWVLSMVAYDRPVFIETGKISLNVLVFALNRCKEYLFRKQNRDIDHSPNDVSLGQWNTFLKKYYYIISREEVFQADKANKLPLYLGYARFLLKEVYRYRPQLSCEGCHNIWIIKPGHNSRGRGIRMASKLGVIMDILNKANSRYVIQKYIEEPLLIYETKFDIRQYYIVTSTYPLVIWMYQDCYLKFSSQKYNLTNYHEAIHLTNNAVQRKYTNCEGRHSDLPKNNMWDLDKYKYYLDDIGRKDVWDNIIYPGMKKSIIGIMLSCQDSLPLCKNRYELYGCDFILDKMYNPWLIEINSCPDLNHTTPVTAKICPAVLADIIKVVVDYPQDRRCSTGKFECIYRQPMTVPRYGPGADLCVRGYALPYSYFYRGNVHIPAFDEDIVDVEKAYNSKAILKKIKEYYDLDTVMLEPSDSDLFNSKEHRRRRGVRTNQSEYELSVAATIITAQLEEELNRVPSENSDKLKSNSPSHASITLLPTKSNKSMTNVESVFIQSKSPTGSTESVTHKPKLDYGKKYQFSRLDDGPTGKGSTVDINPIKEIFDNYSHMKSSNNKNKFSINPASSNMSKSKNIILEATTEIVDFISKKEKEYFSDMVKP